MELSIKTYFQTNIKICTLFCLKLVICTILKKKMWCIEEGKAGLYMLTVSRLLSSGRKRWADRHGDSNGIRWCIIVSSLPVGSNCKEDLRIFRSYQWNFHVRCLQSGETVSWNISLPTWWWIHWKPKLQQSDITNLGWKREILEHTWSDQVQHWLCTWASVQHTQIWW